MPGSYDKVVFAIHGTGAGAGRKVSFPTNNKPNPSWHWDDVTDLYISYIIIDADVTTGGASPRTWWLKLDIEATGTNDIQWFIPDSQLVNSAGGTFIAPTSYDRFIDGMPIYLGDTGGNQSVVPAFEKMFHYFHAECPCSIKRISVSIVTRDFATNTETPADFDGTVFISTSIE